MIKKILFFITAILLVVGCYAQEDILIIELPDIKIEADAPISDNATTNTSDYEENELERKLPISVTVIEVKGGSRAMSTASEEIVRSAGVSIKRYGGLGDFATVSIRGSSMSQVNLFLDGIPLSSASTFFNLGDFNAANLERIEVYRGASPLGFGRSAIGGVINLVPRQSDKIFSTSMKYLTGSFGTRGFNLLSTYGDENYATVLGIGQLKSNGNYTYEDDNGTPYEDDDDEIKTRINNKLEQLDLFGNFSVRGSWGKLKLAHYYFHKKKGMPGIGSYQSEKASFTNEFNQTSLNYELPALLEERITVELKGFHSSKVDAFYDPDGEIGVGRTNNRSQTLSTGASTRATIRLDEYYQELSAFAEKINERFLSSDHLNPGVADNTIARKTTNLALTDRITLFDNRVLINPAIRVEKAVNNFSGDTPYLSHTDAPDNHKTYTLTSRSLGTIIRVSEKLRLKASTAESYRLPNFIELFGSKGTILGNSDLKPEKSRNRDIGFTLRGPAWRFVDGWMMKSAYYLNEVEDLINFEVNSQRTTVAKNISSARLEGVEFQSQVGLFEHFSQALNVTYQQAHDTSDIPYYHGNRLPNRPLYEINSYSELYAKFGKVFFEVNQITRNYLDRANYYEIKNRIIKNAGITLTPYKNNVSLNLEVRNLDNNQVMDIAGYPLPGRSYFSSLNINF